MSPAASPSNPFATRYIKPGALEFIFPPDVSAHTLVERLAAQGWWGAILGPHGAGKSTLLRTLEGALAAAGRRCVWFRLSQHEHSLPISTRVAASWDAGTQIVVDGYEQLGWWSRWRLKRFCRQRGAGLLVTAHGPVGIAELWRVEPSLPTTLAVVEQLLQAQRAADDGQQPPLVTDADIAAAFERERGNVRETLFALYDVYQRRHVG